MTLTRQTFVSKMGCLCFFKFHLFIYFADLDFIKMKSLIITQKLLA